MVTDKVSAADLAVYHQVKQVLSFSNIQIDSSEYQRMSEWMGWLDQSWNQGQIKGRQQFEEISEKLQVGGTSED